MKIEKQKNYRKNYFRKRNKITGKLAQLPVPIRIGSSEHSDVHRRGHKFDKTMKGLCIYCKVPKMEDII